MGSQTERDDKWSKKMFFKIFLTWRGCFWVAPGLVLPVRLSSAWWGQNRRLTSVPAPAASSDAGEPVVDSLLLRWTCQRRNSEDEDSRLANISFYQHCRMSHQSCSWSTQALGGPPMQAICCRCFHSGSSSEIRSVSKACMIFRRSVSWSTTSWQTAD